MKDIKLSLKSGAVKYHGVAGAPPIPDRTVIDPTKVIAVDPGTEAGLALDGKLLVRLTRAAGAGSRTIIKTRHPFLKHGAVPTSLQKHGVNLVLEGGGMTKHRRHGWKVQIKL